MRNLSRIVRSNLKIKHLQLLIAVDHFKSLGKAAQFLNLTQSAVSKNLTEMEQMFDVGLFDRSAAGTLPTVHGKTLLNFARTVLDGFEQTLEQIEAQRHGHDHQLRIGITSLVSPALLAKTAELVKATLPNALIRIEEADLRMLLPRLRAGELDLLISPAEADYMGADLNAETLYAERFHLVVSDTHPLLGNARVDWKDLTHYPWVIPSTPSAVHTKLLQAFHVHGADPPRDVILASSALPMLSLIQHRLAIAIWNSQIVALHVKGGLVRMLPFRLAFRPLTVDVISVHQKSHTALTLDFMTCLRRAAQELEGR